MRNLNLQLKITEPSIRVDLALLKTLREKWPHLSRAALKAWFKQKQILLRGNPVRSSFELSQGLYSISIKNWNPEVILSSKSMPSPRGCFLPLIYEDENLLVFNKNSGIPSVPHSTTETETAVGAALAYCPSVVNVRGKSELEPGIIHRLDTGTSGLLVFAKTQIEYTRLKKAWKQGDVRKIYRVLCRGCQKDLPQIPFTIDLPLIHDPKSSKRMKVIKKIKPYPKSFPAKTKLLSVRLLGKNSLSSQLVDFEIEIQTGVMHQIRCHLAHLGWPILGDPIYHGVPSQRLWLHAWRLEIPLRNETLLKLEAPLPSQWP